MSEHTVTAIEPAWVESEYRPGDEMPEYVADSTEVRDPIESRIEDATYECECGADLDSWADVQQHYEEVDE